jgi:hypothetical protein
MIVFDEADEIFSQEGNQIALSYMKGDLEDVGLKP